MGKAFRTAALTYLIAATCLYGTAAGAHAGASATNGASGAQRMDFRAFAELYRLEALAQEIADDKDGDGLWDDSLVIVTVGAQILAEDAGLKSPPPDMLALVSYRLWLEQLWIASAGLPADEMLPLYRERSNAARCLTASAASDPTLRQIYRRLTTAFFEVAAMGSTEAQAKRVHPLSEKASARLPGYAAEMNDRATASMLYVCENVMWNARSVIGVK